MSIYKLEEAIFSDYRNIVWDGWTDTQMDGWTHRHEQTQAITRIQIYLASGAWIVVNIRISVLIQDVCTAFNNSQKTKYKKRLVVVLVWNCRYL